MVGKSLPIQSLILAVSLSAGFATPLAMAASQADAERKESASSQTEKKQSEASESDDDVEMVEVKISLPDGRTIVRKEPARRTARSGQSRVRSTTRRSSSVKVRRTTSRSGGGNGGGAAVAGSSSKGSSGSSGGGSSSGGGAASSSSGSSAGSGSSSGSAGSAATTKSSSQESDLSGSQTQSPNRGVAIYSAPRASSGTATANASSASVSKGNTRSVANNARRPQRVPTIGNARHHDNGATGGQRVEFRDAGMGAAVIGNTVYFNNVELVRADHEFEIVTGTKVGGDSVIMQQGRLAKDPNNQLSTWNTGASAIKLDFPSNTVVTLTMYSRPYDASRPDRAERTWTVRIR